MRAEKDQEWNFCSHSLSTLQKGEKDSFKRVPSTGSKADDPRYQNAFNGVGNAGGGEGTPVEMKLMLKKLEALEKMSNRNHEMVLEEVASMHHCILSLAVAHSRSHVQAVERIEELAARLDLTFMQRTEGDVPLWDSDLAVESRWKLTQALPKVPGMQARVPRSYALTGHKPEFLTQSLEVELTLEEGVCVCVCSSVCACVCACVCVRTWLQCMW